MNVDVVVGILCISVILIVISVAGFKIYYLKNEVEYLGVLYRSIDKRCGDMFDIMKGQQEEIKELRRMIEPKDDKKPCCGNCRFYHELNDQDSVCLNVDVNNCHKTETTLYANNIPFSCWAIKGVKPNDYCEYYKPKEASDD